MAIYVFYKWVNLTLWCYQCDFVMVLEQSSIATVLMGADRGVLRDAIHLVKIVISNLQYEGVLLDFD